MNTLEMIKEWRKGCSCGPHNPANCPDCTAALIDAIEAKLKNPQGGSRGSCNPIGVSGGCGGSGGGGVIYNGCPVSDDGDSGGSGTIKGGLKCKT